MINKEKKTTWYQKLIMINRHLLSVILMKKALPV